MNPFFHINRFSSLRYRLRKPETTNLDLFCVTSLPVSSSSIQVTQVSLLISIFTHTVYLGRFQVISLRSTKQKPKPFLNNHQNYFRQSVATFSFTLPTPDFCLFWLVTHNSVNVQNSNKRNKNRYEDYFLQFILSNFFFFFWSCGSFS